MEQQTVSYRVAEGREQKVFSQYLLPDIAGRIRQGREAVLLLGAVWGRAACGAAAVRLPSGEEADDRGGCAELLSLYVDPQVRRRGVGEGLLRFALKRAAEAGAAELTASCAAEPETLAALDALFVKLGGEPEFSLPSYVLDSAQFHDARLLGKAFTWRYRRPAQIVLFTELTEAQLEELEQDPELPDFVDPENRPNMGRELSLAYVREGKVAGFWLGGMTALNHYTVQGVWHNSRAPLSCFHELLLAHVNLCFYHCGGDFLYYVSPAAEIADRLIQVYSVGRYQRLEEHEVHLPLRADGGDRESLPADGGETGPVSPEEEKPLTNEGECVK